MSAEDPHERALRRRDLADVDARCGSRREPRSPTATPSGASSCSTRPSTQWRSLQEYSINWITVAAQRSSPTSSARRPSNGRCDARATTSCGPVATPAPTWDSLPASARAKVIARAMVAQLRRGRGRRGRREDHPRRSGAAAAAGSSTTAATRASTPYRDVARAQRAHVHARRAPRVLRALLGEQRDPAGRVGRARRRASSTRPNAPASRASTTSTRTSTAFRPRSIDPDRQGRHPPPATDAGRPKLRRGVSSAARAGPRPLRRPARRRVGSASRSRARGSSRRARRRRGAHRRRGSRGRGAAVRVRPCRGRTRRCRRPCLRGGRRDRRLVEPEHRGRLAR